jgi:serralysin
VRGGSGDDRLRGGKGDDWLEGGKGHNTLKGGDGADTFAFKPDFLGAKGKGAKADGHARVKDFDVARDKIALDAGVFAALGSGLDAGEFRKGKAAKDADDHILYHARSGGLFYDEDGKGGAAAIRFATLDKKLALDEGHFLLL